MVHTLFKRSSGFTWLCLAAELFVYYNFYSKYGDYFEMLKVPGFMVLMFLLSCFFDIKSATELKYSKSPEKNADYYNWCMLKNFDCLVALGLPMVFEFLLFNFTTMWNIAAVYYIIVLVVSVFLKSRGDLASSKLCIVAIFFTPIVAYLLIKYNNTHAKEKAEEYTERAKQSIERGEYSEAIHYATEGIEICPKVKDADYQLSRCYYWRAQAYQKTGENLKAKWDLAKMKALEANE